MRLTHATTYDADVIGYLPGLADRARAADGQAPFSDDLWAAAVSKRTTHASSVSPAPAAHEPERAEVAAPASTEPDGAVPGGAQPVGVAFAAAQGERLAAEVLVEPSQRNRGYGGALLAGLLNNVDGELWVWSHGDHPAARRLAARHGLERARELLQLRRPAALPVPDIEPPANVTIRTFRPGVDEDAWVSVNAAAFSWHPEQGTRTATDLRSAQAEPWFDPAGFFLAEMAGDVVGFHWTKVHPPSAADPAGAPVGEVYVLGVAPQAHGHGIGGYLTAVGLRHLAEVPGLREVMLYVEGDNAAALRVYERLGFSRHTVDVAYRRD